MSDLVEFLKARLKEDETAAKAAGGARWEVGLPNRRIVVAPWEPGDRWSQPEYVAAFVAQDPLADGCRDHIVRHDPARVLREVEAKRQRLARHAPIDDPLHGRLCSRCSIVQASVYQEWPCPDVLDDAAVYSDHPDYQEAWRV